MGTVAAPSPSWPAVWAPTSPCPLQYVCLLMAILMRVRGLTLRVPWDGRCCPLSDVLTGHPYVCLGDVCSRPSPSGLGLIWGGLTLPRSAGEDLGDTQAETPSSRRRVLNCLPSPPRVRFPAPGASGPLLPHFGLSTVWRSLASRVLTRVEGSPHLAVLLEVLIELAL